MRIGFGSALWGSAAVLLAPATALSAVVWVNSTADRPDFAPGDGLCEARRDDGGLASGVCTLRAAIQEANARPDLEHEIFLPRGTYDLRIPVQDPVWWQAGDIVAFAETGDLDIGADVFIEGATGNAEDVVIDGNGHDRVFEIWADPADASRRSVSLRHLTVRGGATAGCGGGIANGHCGAPDLLYDSPHRGGNLRLTDVRVVQNHSGARPTQRLDSAGGGGIFSLASRAHVLDVKRSLIAYNSAPDGVGGGVSLAGDDQAGDSVGEFFVTIESSKLIGNHARLGGGIRQAEAVPARYVAVQFLANFAPDGGGGLWTESTAFVQRSVLAFNAADFQGGAIHNERSPKHSAILILENTTMSHNQVHDPFSGAGGGLFNRGHAFFKACTLHGNRSDFAGAAVFNAFLPGWGSTGFRGSIVSGSRMLDDAIPIANCGGAGDNQSWGGNVDSGTSCQFTTLDQSAVNPMLGSLQDNGGHTLTHALLPGSPAIDATKTCPASEDGGFVTVDQRGVPRPADGDADGAALCDVGAFERQ